VRRSVSFDSEEAANAASAVAAGDTAPPQAVLPEVEVTDLTAGAQSVGAADAVPSPITPLHQTAEFWSKCK